MSFPVYGRVQVAEPASALASLHLHDGTPLKEVDHETPLGVLDQSDLIAQGIHTSRFIPGCKQDAEALGSCTANTAIEAVAGLLSEQDFVAFCRSLIADKAAETCSDYGDVKGAERAVIGFYHACTDQTGETNAEWPPTDCGSSGPYMYELLKRLGVISGQKITHAGEGLVSLLQTGIVCVGSPWFYSWEEPDKDGFIDGDGSPAALEAAIRSGVAGGHETSMVAVEKIAFTGMGAIDPQDTIIRTRNHWRVSWGDSGCCRSHLSTWMMLSGQCDFRGFVR